MPDGVAFLTSDSTKCQACISCRTRKLRCTKEPSGCMRCIGEDTECIYPVRRAMGRPKNRPRHDLERIHDGQLRTAPAIQPNSQKQPNLQGDPDLHAMRNVSLLGSMPGISALEREKLRTQLATDERSRSVQLRIGGVDLVDEIDFSERGSSDGWPFLDIHPESWDTDDASDRNDLQCLAAPSSCLEKLSACEDALSMMPEKFGDALRTARYASKTISEVIDCPRCGIANHLHQIIIVLSNIFELIGNAYIRVAELIDAEATVAENGRGQIVFDLGTYGGLWGAFSERGIKCQEYYQNLAMDANSWRATVRALLRGDIYGFDIHRLNDKGETRPYHHQGLWDVTEQIKCMLSRQTADHEWQTTTQCPFMEHQHAEDRSHDMSHVSEVIDMCQSTLKMVILA